MSRDVIAVDINATVETARALLFAHNVRTLAVTGEGQKLVGAIGLRELGLTSGPLHLSVTKAKTARVDDRAFELLHVLTDGCTHAVFIIDETRNLLGLISPTDLLTAAARELSCHCGEQACAGKNLTFNDRQQNSPRASESKLP